MKGILKTFEVVLALSAVLITFAVLFSGREPLPELETVSWRSAGLNALGALDASNLLRYDALNNNTAVIEGRLRDLLPADVDYLVRVCSTPTCTAPATGAETVVSVAYFISGEAGNSTASDITLYMWSNE